MPHDPHAAAAVTAAAGGDAAGATTPAKRRKVHEGAGAEAPAADGAGVGPAQLIKDVLLAGCNAAAGGAGAEDTAGPAGKKGSQARDRARQAQAQAAARPSRITAARAFYDALVLKNRGYVELSQPRPFEDLAITAKLKLQEFAAHLSASHLAAAAQDTGAAHGAADGGAGAATGPASAGAPQPSTPWQHQQQASALRGSPLAPGAKARGRGAPESAAAAAVTPTKRGRT